MKETKKTKHDPTPIRLGGPPASSRSLVLVLAALALMLPALSAAAGASKNVRLPNITWGVKNVALLGESTSPFRLEPIWPGQPEHTQPDSF